MALNFANLVIFYGFLSSILIVVTGFGFDKTVGPGLWNVITVLKCDNPEQYLFDVEITRHRVDRTHDAFDCIFNVEDDIDNAYGIRIEACKWVDGGCKPYTVLVDNDFCSFIKKYGGENYDKIFQAMKLDPPDCPVPKAKYVVDAFMVNYEELPPEAVYGRFTATLVLVRDAKDLACIKYEVEFNEKD